MLVEIRCAQFRDKVVTFHAGLNVVLGDENATNSIGKSTLLMIVDFAFGGTDLLDHNKDIVAELGHHSYTFVFKFDDTTYTFRRGTIEPGVVFVCGENEEAIQSLELSEFTAFLMQAYAVDLPDISFRSLVNLHLRIWGKDNLTVERPLHTVQAQSGTECVDRLLKELGEFDKLRQLSQLLDALEEQLNAVRNAKQHSVIPKINKPQYVSNQLLISRLQGELAEIKTNLSKYATNLSAIVNKEIYGLKVEKDKLLNRRLQVSSQLQRVADNLRETRHVKSATFKELVAYFPNINQERLDKVEGFHNGLARVLRAELKDSEKELQAELEQIDGALKEIDDEMASSLSSIDQPSALVDDIFKVAISLQEATKENAAYEEEVTLRGKVAEARQSLVEEKETRLAIIQGLLNQGMNDVVARAFGEDRKSPRLSLRPNGYDFHIDEDTGTGTAYASLIVFDLAMFFASQLPIVAHDTILFKNVENDSVASLIPMYMRSQKQSFVALDEIKKYGDEAARLLREQRVIELSDTHVLYVKDWRVKTASSQTSDADV